MNESAKSFVAFLRPVAQVVIVFFCLAINLQAQDSQADKMTFDDQVKGIFRQRCAACHSPDKKSGGLDLTNYTSLMLGGGSGAAIEPGDADGSYLFTLVTHEEEPKMPPDGTKIPDAEIDVLKNWIVAGALENKSSKASIKKKTFDMSVAGSALQRPEKVAMPPHLPLEPVVHTAQTACTTAVAASPWAPLVAVAAPKQILLYNTQTLELAGVLEFPEGIANVLKFSRDGQLLLAGGGRDAVAGKVVVWNVATGQRQMEVGDELDTVLAADISGDLRWIALGGPQKIVRVYSTKDGSLAYECTKHTDWITALAFSPDGVLLATGDRAGGVLVWEAATGNEFLALRGHTERINDIDWRLDSNLVATASQDVTVRLWEVENGGQVKAFNAHGGGTTSVEFSRDGNIVTNGRDKVAKLWNQNGDLQKQFTALPDIGTTVAYCNEAGRVFAGDWSGKLLVSNVADAAPLGELSTNPPLLNERLVGAQAQLQTATSEHQPVAAEVAQLTQQIAQLQTQLAAANAAKQALVAEIAASEKQVTDATQVMQSKLAQKTQMQAEMDEKNKLMPSLTELADKATAVAAISPTDAELQAAATNLTAKLTSTRGRIEELTKLSGEMTTQIAMTEQELKTMTDKLALQKTAMDEQVKQIVGMEAQMVPMQQVMTEKTTLATQLQQKVDAAVALVNRWQGEIQFVSQLKSIEARIAEAQGVVDQKASIRAELEKQMAELKAKIDAASIDEQTAAAQLEAIRQEINSLQGISH